jgi:hypothetical protein
VSDFEGWVTGRLNETLWSKQRDVALSVRDNKYTAVPACFNSGKSWLASRIIAHWVEANAGLGGWALATAPSWSQASGTLWRYVRKLHESAGLRGVIDGNAWRFGPSTVAYSASNMVFRNIQGVCAPKILVVLDEAAGISDDMWNVAASLTTNPDSRVLAIGSPATEPGSYFQGICESDFWNVVPISAEDTPNLSGEDFPGEHLVSTEWVDQRREDWGEESPLFQSKVLARFPA